MSRILAIDYGTKRCGIAVTDSLQIIATGLETIATHTLFTFLEIYFRKEEVGCLVIGNPKKLDNNYFYICTPFFRGIIVLCKKCTKNNCRSSSAGRATDL